jgi:hypothetical protein
MVVCALMKTNFKIFFGYVNGVVGECVGDRVSGCLGYAIDIVGRVGLVLLKGIKKVWVRVSVCEWYGGACGFDYLK